MLVVPCEEEFEGVAGPLIDMFEKSLEYLEMPLAGIVFAPGVGARGEVNSHPACLEGAREAGRVLANWNGA